MTCPDCPICAHSKRMWDEAAARIEAGVVTRYDTASHADEDSLRRSFGRLSKAGRRVQRRPMPFVVDELGYTPTGTWSGGAA